LRKPSRNTPASAFPAAIRICRRGRVRP